jgi:hypothetical protein
LSSDAVNNLLDKLKAQPGALLPENNSVANSDMPENLNAVAYVKK